MLLAGYYRFRSPIDAGVGLKRFMAWTPPVGFTFQHHSGYRGLGKRRAVHRRGGDWLPRCSRRLRSSVTLLEFDIVPVIDIADLGRYLNARS